MGACSSTSRDSMQSEDLSYAHALRGAYQNPFPITPKPRFSWTKPDLYEDTHTNVSSVNGPYRDAMPP